MVQAAIDELRKINQWVAHNSAKAPLATSGYASVSDSKTWMTSAIARTTAINRTDATGVGFVFTASDPYVGIDLDNAVKDGVIKPWAQKVVDHWSSYTEYSPSGCGLHIIARGSVPHGTRMEMGDGLLELYSERRYFTVTGKHVDGTPSTIEAVDTHAWHVKKFKPAPPPKPPRREFKNEVDDDLVWVPDALAHIFPDDYEIWVEIGMALKDRFGDAGFGLWDYWSSTSDKYDGSYRLRRKWDSFKGYGLTFGTFVQHARDAGFDMPKGVQVESLRCELSADAMAAAKAIINEHWLGLTAPDDTATAILHDFATMYLDRREPEPELVDGLLGANQILLLSGEPKIGKTFLTAQLAVCAALGKPFLGMPIGDSLRVLHVQYEMSEEAMRQRFQLQQLTPDEVSAIAGRYHITSKKSAELLTFGYAEKIKAELDHSVDIIIIDPLINAFNGDENSAGDMGAFIRLMIGWARTISEDAAIVLTHHNNKMGGIRGSSALRGFYDTGLTMTHTDAGLVKLSGEFRHREADSDMIIRLEQGVFVEAVTSDDRAGVAAMVAAFNQKDVEDVLTYIKTFDSEVSREHLRGPDARAICGVTTNRMSDILKELVEDMRIKKVRPGWYSAS